MFTRLSVSLVLLFVATTSFAQSATPAPLAPIAPRAPVAPLAPVAPPAPRTARTIQYHPHDLVILHTKVRFTTLVSLPDGDDIVEATCGDKEFWIVNARNNIAYVKPAKPSSETNLNLLTTSGHLYTFQLSEISDMKGVEPDLVVYLESDDPSPSADMLAGSRYVRASQVEDFRAQAEIAREDLRKAIDTARTQLEDSLNAFRSSYPLKLHFPYQVQLNRPPFFVQAIFHDDRATYIQARATELPVLYEMKDRTANLVNFDVRNGTYVVPKILDEGYLVLGKKRVLFKRLDSR
jgi:type IV secretory pathway VirB9-like protein